MPSLHGICAPQTKGVNEKEEGPTTYVVSLPGILQLVRCPVPGFPAVAQSAGRLREHFMFRLFFTDSGGQGGKGTAALLRLVRHANDIAAAHQVSTGGLMQ